MGGIKQAERHTKEQITFYMSEAVKKLGPNAAISVAKSAELKNFLLCLAGQAPKESNAVLKEAYYASVKTKKELDAQKKEQVPTTKKRAAPSQEDMLKQFKKTKVGHKGNKADGEPPFSASSTVSGSSVSDVGGC